jgi:ubiquinone/menaquinone biosynthesis C-methylase UbiE
MVALQPSHKMSPAPSHDEFARQEFCRTFRSQLLGEIQKGTRTVYEQRVRPKFKKENGRDVKDRHEIRHAMDQDHYYRLYCASLRGVQEMIWDSVIDTVERDHSRLTSTFKGLHNQAKGTLKVDPDLEIPRYHTAADIHLQPGGYHTDVTEDDLSAGAVYDRALYVYGDGKFGQYNDAMGHMVIDLIREAHPSFVPQRILDMGCSAGHSTLAYVDAFPEAEVHGLDVGAPMVRFAHARAEALGKTAHFSQQNAERTNFEDESFDLIVSHIIFHETSRRAMPNILKECHRLLKPGGLMVHLDLPLDRYVKDMFASFLWDWEAYHNNETFEVVFRNLDYEEEARNAGFAKENVALEQSPFRWPVLFGKK